MQNSIVCSICKKDQTIITDLDSGEIVCSKCGLVISDKIQDTRQEWRDFVNSEEAKDRRRTGMPFYGVISVLLRLWAENMG
jgi:transcription initiation factor TFIIB